MWVKNTNTGNVWFVEEEHGKKLLKQDYFEEAEAPEVRKATKKGKKDEE